MTLRARIEDMLKAEWNVLNDTPSAFSAVINRIYIYQDVVQTVDSELFDDLLMIAGVVRHKHYERIVHGTTN